MTRWAGCYLPPPPPRLPLPLFICWGSGLWRGASRPFVCLHFPGRLHSRGGGEKKFPENRVDPAHIGQIKQRAPLPPPREPCAARRAPEGGWGDFPRMPFMWTHSCHFPGSSVNQDPEQFPEVWLVHMWPAVAVTARGRGPAQDPGPRKRPPAPHCPPELPPFLGEDRADTLEQPPDVCESACGVRAVCSQQ